MKQRFFLFSFAILLLYSCTNNKQLIDPKIQFGRAKIIGSIVNSPFEGRIQEESITLKFANPVTAEICEFKAVLNKDGSFYFNIPVACKTVGFIESRVYQGGVCMVPNEETFMEIIYDESGKKHLIMKSSINLTSEDMIKIGDVVMNMVSKPIGFDDYRMNSEDFSKSMISKMEGTFKTLNNNTGLSENAKYFITNTVKMFFLDTELLHYSDMMRFLGRQKNNQDTNNFIPEEPDKSYYTFLRYFDLNNPQYLYSDYYFRVLQSILANKTLDIPQIGDISISDWLKKIKIILSEYIGANKGLFYDMLVANAYAKQFNDEKKPLSDIQKENIIKYFKNQSFVDILFSKNDQIISAKKQSDNLVANTPDVPKEEVMNSIVSKYKGKVIIVDFWATWCEPCLEAMEKFKEIKQTMQGKKIVFIYITDLSSPIDQWEKQIKGIDGDHYYLNQEEWNYIKSTYNFEVIPTYLFFDSSGEFINKITGYPGTDEMRSLIEKLL